MGEWWEKPLRAITLEFPASDVANIDVVGIIDESLQGAINTLCVFAIGYYPGGTSFYQSKIAPHYPGLGKRDLLAEAIEAGHRHHQKVIAYVASIWGNAELYQAHPDWAQRKANGEVTSWDEQYNSVAMCPNSPFRDYLASLVREISETYEVDGFYFDEASFQSWCACQYCQERFRRETGKDLPRVENWADPVFQQFIAWRYQQISQWREELYYLAKRDHRCVFFQGAFPLAKLSKSVGEVSGIQFENPYQMRFGVEWHVPLAHATYLPDTARVGDIVHFELYRRAVHEPLWWYGIALKYGQSIAKGKRILTLNMMAQTPFDLHGLPEPEMRLSVAEILANGGDLLFARYYPDRVDQPAWQMVYSILKDVSKLNPFLTDCESVKYAAIFYSQTTADLFDQSENRTSHLGCLKGFVKALRKRHILFDILNEESLEDRIEDYKVLILPNVACISERNKQVVREFIANGGGVVASFETGRYNEAGKITPEDDFSEIFGLEYAEGVPQWFGFDVYMRLFSEVEFIPKEFSDRPIPTGGIQVEVIPKGAQIAAQVVGGAAVHYGPLGEELGPPSILTYQSEGKGRAVYFAFPVGNRYLEFGVPAYQGLMAKAISWTAGVEPPIQLENAPQTLSLNAYWRRGREGKQWIVHLVNSMQVEPIGAIDEVISTPWLTLKIRNLSEPRKITSLLHRAKLSWSFQEGTLAIQIPPITYHEVVLIEF